MHGSFPRTLTSRPWSANSRPTGKRSTRSASHSRRSCRCCGLFAHVLRAGTRQLRGAELRRGRLIIGGPEDCLEQIAACRERVPIGCLILRMQWLGMPHARVARAIELVGAKLLPALRRL
jgi:alkanesulfonate monooxygenase SsuD/methylene tetrahydromethanopterin reductase-like flavin-dependent oxidoreductase (luciferase family)